MITGLIPKFTIHKISWYKSGKFIAVVSSASASATVSVVINADVNLRIVIFITVISNSRFFINSIIHSLEHIALWKHHIF